MINSPREIIDLIESNDEACQLRLKSDCASAITWEKFLQQRPDLKRVVTLNKTLDERTIRLLANDADPLVRADIANRRKLPHDLLELLARDASELVRARVAWNRKTPNEILKVLLEDKSKIVAEPARKKLRISLELGGEE